MALFEKTGFGAFSKKSKGVHKEDEENDAGIEDKMKDEIKRWWDATKKKWTTSKNKETEDALGSTTARLESLATMRGLLAEL